MRWRVWIENSPRGIPAINFIGIEKEDCAQPSVAVEIQECPHAMAEGIETALNVVQGELARGIKRDGVFELQKDLSLVPFGH